MYRLPPRVAALAVPLLLAALVSPSPGMQGEDPLMGETRTGDPGTRVVLEGVPQIGYFVHGCPFPGSVESLFQYIGDPVDYDYVMGVTGACFRRIWSRDDGGNVDLGYLSPAPYDRLFRALGYEYRLVPRDDRAACIEAVRESIGRGVPVISFGPLGPPEAGLIAGYADGGETAIGWSYFQDGATPGYYELPGWFEKSDPGGPAQLLVLGKRLETRPSDRETLAESLKWAVELALVSDRLPGYRCGLAGYDAWADSLEVDADYPAGDKAVLETRLMIHGDQWMMLDERRSAAAYLRNMRERVPEVGTELAAAAGHYDNAAGECANTYVPWAGPGREEAIVDPARRRAMAQAIRAARASEAQAVEYLRAAVRQLDPEWKAPSEEGAAEAAPPASFELTKSERAVYPADLNRAPEDMPLSGAFRAALDFVGEGFGSDLVALGGGNALDLGQVEFMAATGEAFSMVWLPKPGAAPDRNSDYAGPDPTQPFRDALTAAGLTGEVRPHPRFLGLRDTDAGYVASGIQWRVVRTLRETGMPLIAAELPKPGSYMVVTGYEESGAVLTGWECEPGGRGITFEPGARVRVPDWTGKLRVLVSLTGKQARPTGRDRFRPVLERAVLLLRADERGAFLAGPAGLEAWAARITAEDFPAGDPDAIQRTGLLEPMPFDLAERRWYGTWFLKAAAREFPEAGERLEEAARHFQAEHDLMWELTRACGERFANVKDPAVRERISAILLRCRDLDAEAAQAIEAALARM